MDAEYWRHVAELALDRANALEELEAARQALGQAEDKVRATGIAWIAVMDPEPQEMAAEVPVTEVPVTEVAATEYQAAVASLQSMNDSGFGIYVPSEAEILLLAESNRELEAKMVQEKAEWQAMMDEFTALQSQPRDKATYDLGKALSERVKVACRSFMDHERTVSKTRLEMWLEGLGTDLYKADQRRLDWLADMQSQRVTFSRKGNLGTFKSLHQLPFGQEYGIKFRCDFEELENRYDRKPWTNSKTHTKRHSPKHGSKFEVSIGDSMTDPTVIYEPCDQILVVWHDGTGRDHRYIDLEGSPERAVDELGKVKTKDDLWGWVIKYASSDEVKEIARQELGEVGMMVETIKRVQAEMGIAV